MNNCPKCGNPLQVGTTSCPICGTNISATEPSKTPATESVSVTSVGQPVQASASSPTAPAAVEENKQATSPVAEASSEPVKAPNQEQAPAPAPQPAAPAPKPLEASAPAQTQSNPSESTAPVAEAPTPAPAAPVAAPTTNTQEANVTAQTEPVVANTSVAPTPEAQVQTNVAQAPTNVGETSQEAAPANAIAPTNNATPVASTETPVQAVAPTNLTIEAPADPNSIAPTVATIEASTPVPSIPASVNPTVEPTKVEASAVTKASNKPKMKMNKNVLIIGGIVLVAIIGIVLYTMLSKPKTLTPPAPTDDENLATTSISSNGYNFKLEDGWMITEDGTNVIVTNSTDTVVIKLSHLDANIDAIGISTIENYFNSHTEFSDSKVEEMEISTKKAILVNANYNQAQVQYYYIGSGSSLTIGATVIYQSNESKTKFEADVTELIGTLTYADESIKALDTIGMYANIFKVYNDITNYNPTPEPPDNNEQNNEQNNNQNNEQNDQNQVTPDPNTQVEQNPTTGA